MAPRALPHPEANPETNPYWEAAKKGVLLLKRCIACGRAHHYPRALCPFCFSDRLEWQAASGKGTIYSFSVMKRSPVPYAIAYVTLEEGPIMLTNIVDCDFAELRIGARVHLVCKLTEGGASLPMFTPD